MSVSQRAKLENQLYCSPTIYCTSEGKIKPILVYMHIQHTQISILLTTEDPMLNTGYSIAVMCMMLEQIFDLIYLS